MTPDSEARARLWLPAHDALASTRLGRFASSHGLSGYPELLQRSREDPAWFWDAVIRDLGIHWLRPYSNTMDTSEGIAWTKWFRGGLLNVADYCLDSRALGATAAQVAFSHEDEAGQVVQVSYAELARQVARAAWGMRELGISKGDRVAIFMPMCPEVVVSCLALAKIGAVIVPLFSGYGPGAVATRLSDAEASALICAGAFTRKGLTVNLVDIVVQVLEQCPQLARVIVAERPQMGVSAPADQRFTPWREMVMGQADTCPSEAMDPEDPLMIIYTSGTTGKPKGTVHVHGGFPIKAAQDMAHCFDIGESDTVFWVTDIGWMMGPWEIFGSLALGANFVVYEGSPDHPSPDRLWKIVDRHQVTVLGVSPTLIRSLMGHGKDAIGTQQLSSLRILGSTGEPWNDEPWAWFFSNFGRSRLPIINYSGGTEIAGGILGGNLLTPCRPGSFAGPIPGMDAEVVGDDGRPVRGQVGELVIRQPWPGMTRGFWKDPERYLATYWSRWPQVWVHGDWAIVDPDGLWQITGRSDDTIKLAGKRVGPAEVESVLVSHPSVAEAAAIGVPDPVKGEALTCFVVLKPGTEASDQLEHELIHLTVAQLGKSMRPGRIVLLSDLPKTRNAKILRRVLRATYLGLAPGDLSSLENPEILSEIVEHASNL